jgi:hypothetical protein
VRVDQVKKWLKNFGFALLVLVALGLGVRAGLRCSVPDPVPDFALKSIDIYRVEVGAGCFIAFYLAATAFVLALNGRGVTEIGREGLKTKEFVNRELDKKQQKSIDEQMVADRAMLTSIEGLSEADSALIGAVDDLRGRVRTLEGKADDK